MTDKEKIIFGLEACRKGMISMHEDYLDLYEKNLADLNKHIAIAKENWDEFCDVSGIKISLT